jgi:hypothetical protein
LNKDTIVKKERPSNQIFGLGNNILKWNDDNSWTSTQGCYQCNLQLDDAWTRQQGCVHSMSSRQWICPQFLWINGLWKPCNYCHRCHWIDVWQGRIYWR